MPGASQVDALVEALDIYPTLMDLCGIEKLQHIHGESLVPLLEDPDAVGDAEAVSQYPRNNESIMGYGMRTDRYRYVEWRAAGSSAPVEVELYDHIYDPGEDTNVVASTDASILAALAAQLEPHVDEAYRFEAGFGDQLISNGEFDLGMTDWEGNGDANFTPQGSDGSNGLGDDALLHVDPVTPGTGIWTLALEQVTGIDASKSYTIRFVARAETARNMKVLWRNKDNAVSAYFDSGTFEVSTTAQTYQFSSVVPGNLSGIDPDAELRLQFGADAADIWIDSVEVYEEVGAVVTESFAEYLQDAGLTGADALAYADADGDGVNNLFEYACNMDLTIQDNHKVVPGSGINGLPNYQMVLANSAYALELEYLCRLGADELEYIAEFTDNLISNVWTSGGVEYTVPIDSAWERIMVQDSETTETASNRFGRVRILLRP
jgi:hypothetical protein